MQTRQNEYKSLRIQFFWSQRLILSFYSYQLADCKQDKKCLCIFTAQFLCPVANEYKYVRSLERGIHFCLLSLGKFSFPYPFSISFCYLTSVPRVRALVAERQGGGVSKWLCLLNECELRCATLSVQTSPADVGYVCICCSASTSFFFVSVFTRSALVGDCRQQLAVIIGSRTFVHIYRRQHNTNEKLANNATAPHGSFEWLDDINTARGSQDDGSRASSIGLLVNVLSLAFLTACCH